ncbi:MAG: hypothetical protein JW893_00360, partial [Candidatus Omnitrophica bacterium]|nr:hypothetical protein [Candidatus Omnitrophota bacterium]
NKRLSVLVTIVFVISSITGNGLIAFSADEYTIQGSTYIPATQYYASPSPVSSSSPNVVQSTYAAGLQPTTSLLNLAKADTNPLSSGESESEAVSEPELAMSTTTTEEPEAMTPEEAFHELQLRAIGVEEEFVNRKNTAIGEWVDSYEAINKERVEKAISLLSYAISVIEGSNSAYPSASPSSASSPSPNYGASPVPVLSSPPSPSPGPSASPNPSPAPGYHVEMKRYEAFGSISQFESLAGGGDLTADIKAMEELRANTEAMRLSAIASGDSSLANRSAALLAYIDSVLSVLNAVQAKYDAVNTAKKAAGDAWLQYQKRIQEINEEFNTGSKELIDYYKRGLYIEGKLVKPGDEIYLKKQWVFACPSYPKTSPGCESQWFEYETPSPYYNSHQDYYQKTGVILNSSVSTWMPYQKAYQDLQFWQAQVKAFAAADYYEAVLNYFNVLKNTEAPTEILSGVASAYIQYLKVVENERSAAGGDLNVACSPFTSAQGVDCVTSSGTVSGMNLRADFYGKAANAVTGLVKMIKGALNEPSGKDAKKGPIAYGEEQAVKALGALRDKKIAQIKWNRDSGYRDYLASAEVRDEAYRLLEYWAREMGKIHQINCFGNIECEKREARYWSGYASSRWSNELTVSKWYWSGVGWYVSEVLNWADSRSNKNLPPVLGTNYFPKFPGWQALTFVLSLPIENGDVGRLDRWDPEVAAALSQFRATFNPMVSAFSLKLNATGKSLETTYSSAAKAASDVFEQQKKNLAAMLAPWKDMAAIESEYAEADKIFADKMVIFNRNRSNSLAGAWSAYRRAIA